MSSKAPLRDSSVSSAMLRPHMRRQSRGLSSYTSELVTSVEASGRVFSYTNDAGGVVTVTRMDWGSLQVSAPTAVQVASGVTASPWRYVAQSDVTIELVASCVVAGAATAWLVVTVDDVDILSSLPAFDGPLIASGCIHLYEGQVVKVWLRTADWDADPALQAECTYTMVTIEGYV